MNTLPDFFKKQIANIKLVLTDCDGVLTDTGVYYSEKGEELKRFSIRDGMGVERLRTIAKLDVGFVTGESSGAVVGRAAKLNIKELHLGIKDKVACLTEILTRLQLSWENIAYIGDDVNDLEVIKKCGFTACPSDAMPEVREEVHFVCVNRGGNGAFREFAEVLIEWKNEI